MLRDSNIVNLNNRHHKQTFYAYAYANALEAKNTNQTTNSNI